MYDIEATNEGTKISEYLDSDRECIYCGGPIGIGLSHGSFDECEAYLIKQLSEVTAQLKDLQK